MQGEKKQDALCVKGLNLVLDRKHILKDIHFRVKSGEFVAIVGEIGAGKTSLLQSLLKVYKATYDAYEVEGENAETLGLSILRSKFSYVPQELFVINSTLRDNISLEYDTDPKYDKAILNSLYVSQFSLKQENMNFSLDTEIGERGVNLSGGQKQRVTLARCHFADRNIVLLDDCLSAVDVTTEEKLTESLLCGAWKNKTRILATHRLSILSHCDRVFIMKNGEIVENDEIH